MYIKSNLNVLQRITYSDSFINKLKERKNMLPAKIHDLKNKVFTIIVATVLTVTIISLIFYYYFYNKSRDQYHNINEHKIKRFFVEYFQQKKGNLDYMVSCAKKSYQDAALHQRYITREKSRAVQEFYANLQTEIKLFNDNPFFAKMMENLRKSYLQKKVDIWKRYNRYGDKVESFAKSKKYKHVHFVALNGQVVWSSDKSPNTIFRHNLNTAPYSQLDVAKAFSQGKTQTRIYHTKDMIFVCCPTKDMVTIFEIEIRNSIAPILHEGKTSFISNIFILDNEEHSQESAYSEIRRFMSQTQKKNGSSIYRDINQRFVIGSFQKIEGTPWTLYLESQLRDVLYRDLQFLMTFYHVNEQASVHIFFAKTMQALFTTQNSDEKITDFLKSHLQKKSFAMVVDASNNDWGNIYLVQKIALEEHFPLYIVIRTSGTKIEKQISVNTQNVEFQLFMGRRHLLPKTLHKVAAIKIFQQQGIIAMKKSPMHGQLSMYFVVAMIGIVILVICYYCLAPQFSGVYHISCKDTRQWQEVKNNLCKVEESLNNNTKEAENLRLKCYEASNQLQEFITANQNLEEMLENVEKVFKKLIKILRENVQNIDKISHLVNQLTKYQHNISATISRAKSLSFTSSILSLNTSIEASNSLTHEAFAILAKEYQGVASNIQYFLHETTRQVIDSANDFHVLNQLTNRQQLAREMIGIMQSRLQLLIRVKEWCQEQKIPLKNMRHMLNKIEESSVIQVIELQTAANNLNNIIAFFARRETNIVPEIHNSLLQKPEKKIENVSPNTDIVPLKEVEDSDF